MDVLDYWITVSAVLLLITSVWSDEFPKGSAQRAVFEVAGAISLLSLIGSLAVWIIR